MSRVMCFIHSKLSRFCFSLRKDIADHKNIQLETLFSFIPLSYMVVSSRELVNTLFHSPSKHQTSTLCSTMVQNPSNINMDVNNNIIRKRFSFSNKVDSRSSLISLSTSSIPYYQYMEINNDFLLDMQSLDASFFIFLFYFLFDLFFFIFFNLGLELE